MSAKAISEATGKDLLNRFLKGTAEKCHFASVDEENWKDWKAFLGDNAWMQNQVGIG